MLKNRFNRRLEILEANFTPPAGRGLAGEDNPLSAEELEAAVADRQNEGESHIDADSAFPEDETARLAAEVRALEARRAELKADRKR